MIKLVQIDDKGVDGATVRFAPVVARFARGWVIFFVAAAVLLLLSMWARASALDASPRVDEDREMTAAMAAS